MRELTPDIWTDTVPGRRWLIYFALQGCKHCERLRPMIEHVAGIAPELRVGRVDATEHNGLARTFGVKRYPTILLFDEDGQFFEFHGTRSPPRLLSFARGAGDLLGAGQPAPTTLLDNVSEWWLLLEAMWDPLKTAFMYAAGIALAIKGGATALLRCLERGKKPKKRRADAAQEGAENVKSE